MPRTSMPAARHATNRSRGFAYDGEFRETCFPGIGMSRLRPREWYVEWCDTAGRVYTSQAFGTLANAVQHMREIEASLVYQKEYAHMVGGEPVRGSRLAVFRGLRVVEG